jgi:GNAT superfamily N-acetyltransferase
MSLADLLACVERGEHLLGVPPLLIVPQPSPRAAAVLAFTGLNIVVADIDPAWVRGRLPADDLSAPLNPPFLGALEEKTGRRVNNVDGVFLAAPAEGEAGVPLTPVDDADHPRVRRARRYRDDVGVWTTPGGVLILGRGLAGRWEAAIEVDEAARDRGLGRRLAAAARTLVPEGRPVWAQISPGNASSVRAFLAAGYVPVGAEALLVP